MSKPKFVTVPVTKDFSFQGRDYARGETVEMTPLDAAIHRRRGEVSLTVPALRSRDMHAEESEPTRRRRSRKTSGDDGREYRRRDMVPEP